MFQDGLMQMPPHYLGPPVQNPGLASMAGLIPGLGQMMGRPPQGPGPQGPPGWDQGQAWWKQLDNQLAPGLSKQEPMDPTRSAALAELGKYLQAHGKAQQAFHKAREAQSTLHGAMQQMRAAQPRY